jgi:hypothetical protein
MAERANAVRKASKERHSSTDRDERHAARASLPGPGRHQGETGQDDRLGDRTSVGREEGTGQEGSGQEGAASSGPATKARQRPPRRSADAAKTTAQGARGAAKA